MKKILSLFLALAITLFIPVNVFAKSNTLKLPKENIVTTTKLPEFNIINALQTKTTRMSEYDIIKSLQAKSNNELKAMGMSVEDISKLKSFNYKEEFIKRTKLSADQLKKMGYTDSQIVQLKTFNGTEQSLSLSSAQIWLSSGDYYCYNYGHDVTIDFWWTWTARPLCQYTDEIGMGWVAENSSGYSLATTFVSSGTYCNATYSQGTTKANSVIPLGGGHAKTLFPLNGPKPSGSNSYEYNTKGYGTIHFHSTGVVYQVEYRAGYGHSVLIVTPSLNVDSGVSFGFTPSWSCTEQTYTYKVFSNQI